MKGLVFMVMLLSFASSAFAKKNCTSEPKSKWMSVEAFKSMAEKDGYKISKFKQPGTCYEIYGANKDGKKIEIYFNPVDGSIVKEK